MQSQRLKAIRNPLTKFRPWPFFVLNEEHEGEMGEPRITEMLEAFKVIGYGGVYIHPRPGLITAYLSERWFELVRHIIKECQRLGLTPCLYDENSYPSGFAGGHTLAHSPDTRARHVLPVFGHGPHRVPDDHLALYKWQNEKPGDKISKADLTESDEWLAFALRDFPSMPFHAEAPYVSLLDPMTSHTFLKVTHQRYREELTDDEWKCLGSIFTDEPHLVGSSHGPWSQGLHCTPYVIGAFNKRYGMDLRSHFIDLYFDTEKSESIRFDYYELIHQLWVDNWAKPLENWCKNNKINLTGHYLEHDWPAPYSTPGQMHILAHQDWPGTDLLESFALLGHDFGDPQNFDPTIPGQEPQALYFLKQALSVANQYGKERVMNESWGAGGHDSTPADWSRIGRYLAVHGVNQFVPHHSFLTISGTRKQDHPQFFSDQSPWFDFLRPLNDEMARLSYAATLGSPSNRVLLLDALTTAYVKARKGDAISSHAAASADDTHAVGNSLASMDSIRKSIIDLAQSMSNELIDFDIGDEYIIEESGFCKDSKLHINQCAYQLIVWPPMMQNLRESTAKTIEEYLECGGILVGIRPERILVNGRPSELYREWLKKYPNQIQWHDSHAKLLPAIKTRIQPRLSFDNSPTTGLAQLYRDLGNGEELYLLVNSHPEEFLEASLTFEGKAKYAMIMDTFTGETCALREDDKLYLNPTKACIIYRSENEGVTHPHQKKRIRKLEESTPRFIRAERIENNVLIVDICTLELDGQAFEPMTVYKANEVYWRSNGILANGWLQRVQFNDSLMQRDRYFSADSGGKIHYYFEIDHSVNLNGVWLGIEHPERWHIQINGRPASFQNSKKWRDPAIRSCDFSDFLKHGTNHVEVEGRHFSVKQEIDALYIMGDFSVDAANLGFRISGPSRQLALGSWREQGMPFYDQAVDYYFETTSEQSSSIYLEKENWNGSVLELIHGDYREMFYGPDVEIELDDSRAKEFIIRMIGLPKNIWGPWHVKTQPRKKAWSNFWRCDGITTDAPRPGHEYDLLDLGFFKV